MFLNDLAPAALVPRSHYYGNVQADGAHRELKENIFRNKTLARYWFSSPIKISRYSSCDHLKTAGYVKSLILFTSNAPSVSAEVILFSFICWIESGLLKTRSIQFLFNDNHILKCYHSFLVITAKL